MSLFVDTCMRMSVRCLGMSWYGCINGVCGCPRTFFDGVHVRRHADKFCLVDHAIRRGTKLALVDQLVEGAAGNAQLTGSVGFGELGHGAPRPRARQTGSPASSASDESTGWRCAARNGAPLRTARSWCGERAALSAPDRL